MHMKSKTKTAGVIIPPLCLLELLLTLLDLFPRHSSSQNRVPVNKEWLREIRLDPDDLMVDIVVISIIATEHLERVKGETVSAVIVNRFHGTESKQENSLPNREHGNSLGYHGTKTVE